MSLAKPARPPVHLGDFTTTPRTLVIMLLACVAGAVSTAAAWVLLKLIGFFTNLAFYQRFSTELIAPGAGHHPAWMMLALPVLGGLLVGLMARFGSEAIRGHGMPEAIDAILRGQSKVKPRIALLKPLSAAISIGTGGPFGAEGPIIMTGGAFGSLLAQFLALTADERKTLLVSGAAAGMAATFNAPFASLMLAVELLLFEWRPRSFLPVAAAVCVASILRVPLLGGDAVFPVATLAPALHASGYLACLACGVVGGLLAVIATRLIYASEDTFMKLPLHWMWWPAIGGLIIGVGGMLQPRALGVGYDVIGELLRSDPAMNFVLGLLVVKTLIWSLSLGSGTSGGVLAPIIMMGAALGSVLGHYFPLVAPGFWALVCVGAVIGGVMRVPLTAVIFVLELTHDWTAVLPLVIASSTAYALSVLILKRSVLTEKVARKGFHLTREYTIDPLELLLVGEVMKRDFIGFGSGEPLSEVADVIVSDQRQERELRSPQRLYPVCARDGRQLVGVVTRSDLLQSALAGTARDGVTVDDIMTRQVVCCYRDITLREASYLLAEHGVAYMPVLERDSERVVGVLALEDLLQARLVDLHEDRVRERVLDARSMMPRALSARSARTE